MPWNKYLSHNDKIHILMNKFGMDHEAVAIHMMSPGKWDDGISFEDKVSIMSECPGWHYELAHIRLTEACAKAFTLPKTQPRSRFSDIVPFYSNVALHGYGLGKELLSSFGTSQKAVDKFPSCRCGDNKWDIGVNGVTCSNCRCYLEITYKGNIVEGPECNCGHHGWFIGANGVRCAYCDRYREITYGGNIVKGPECSCGHHGWFIGANGVRCAYCDRYREVSYHGYTRTGPDCVCGKSGWFEGLYGHRCAYCDRWREK